MNIIHGLPPEQHKGTWVGVDSELYTKPGDKEHLHRPSTGKFACITISVNDEDVYFIDDVSLVPEALRRIDKCVWCIQNAKFDITHFRKWANVPPRKQLFDTMLIERILFNGLFDKGGYSLQDLSRRWLEMPLRKDVREEFEGAKEFTPERIEYACLDANVTRKIALAQRAVMDTDDRKIWSEIDLPALWAFLDFQGFAINVDGWKTLAEENLRIKKEIDAILPINPKSPVQVMNHLRKCGFKKLESSDQDHLEEAIKKWPDTEAAKLAEQILLSRKHGDRAAKYGLDMIADFVEYDNGVPVVYPNYNIIGAETGRTCVAGDTILETDKGNFEIRSTYLTHELQEEKEYRIRTHTGSWQRILKQIYKGRELMYEIRTSEGGSIICTEKHRLLTPYEEYVWREVKDLQVGDDVIVEGFPFLGIPDHPGKILSKEKVGIRNVWDIEVETDHSYVAGGLVHHNSCSNPNMQNIPARETSAYRELFIARPGHVLVIADYGAQEPRIMAYVSQDEYLLNCFNTGKDPYISLAKDAFDEEITKKDPRRKLYKDIVLGIGYGLSKYGLADKVEISTDEAQILISKASRILRGAAKWGSKQAEENRLVRTPFGRKCWLNPYSGQSPRNARNAPIQGGAADMMKYTLSQMHQHWPFPFPFCAVAMVHDELVFDFPAEYKDQGIQFVQSYMEEKSTEMVHGQIRFIAEVYSGSTWAEKH